MATEQLRPHHPIVYVRGFAATQGEIEETVADPYMGFNTGSTKTRAVWTGDVKRFYFQSPLVRLMIDHGYTDVFVEGEDLLTVERDGSDVPYRSIIIYRNYEAASSVFEMGDIPPIEHFALGLDKLILRLRDKVCSNPSNGADSNHFCVCRFDHSIGSLLFFKSPLNPNLSVAEEHSSTDRTCMRVTQKNEMSYC